MQGKKSLYPSPSEFQSLIRQVLSWDIRSVSQRSRPHETKGGGGGDDIENTVCDASKAEGCHEDEAYENGHEKGSGLLSDVVYHLMLEGLDVSYRIDADANVFVEKVSFPSVLSNSGGI